MFRALLCLFAFRALPCMLALTTLAWMLALNALAFLGAGQVQEVRPRPPIKRERDDKRDDRNEGGKRNEPPPLPGLPTDVPVVSPGKGRAEKGEPPTAEGDDQATLPTNFVRNRVDNMKSGTEAYVALSAVRCDAKKKVWLHPHALTGPKTNERPIIVKRDGTGYHVVFESIEHQWEAAELDPKVNWVPVRTVTVK